MGGRIFLVLTLGIFAVSTSAVLVRFAIASANLSSVGFSLVLAASRISLAAILLIPNWRNFSGTSAIALRNAIYAGLALGIHFAVWITSLSYTSVAASTTLVTTNPIWVALISWVWFREKPSRITFLGIAIALLGGVIISLDGSQTVGSNPLLGNGLAILGAWAASFYLLFGREAQQQGLGLGQYVTVAYSVAAIALLPLPFFFNTSYLGYPNPTYVAILLMALLPQLVGHTSFNWSVRVLSPTIVALVLLLEPVGATILAALVFREVPGIQGFIGAIALLIGVAIAIQGNRTNSAKLS
jgi:drug/metabolite transporter (DMT)-like permease